MTLETLKKLEKECTDKMRECMAEHDKAQEARKAAHKQYAAEYAQEHPELAKFLGKKVKITEKNPERDIYPSIVGYLEGFEMPDCWWFCVKPILYKVKKDGSRSKTKYPLYEVPFADDMICEIVQ